MEAEEENGDVTSSEELFIGSVCGRKKIEEWTEVIQVCENPKVFIKFKLDTGAEVSVIPSYR